MKNVVFTIALILLSTVSIFAQDIIMLKNGQTLKVKVEEIDNEYVKYYRLNDLNGTLVSMPKTDIIQIKYKNGKVAGLNAVTTLEKIDSLPSTPKSNIYAYGAKRFYISAQTSFVKNTKSNFGAEIEVPISDLFGLVASYGIGKIDASKLNGAYGQSAEDLKFSGYTLGIRAHTAAKLKNNQVDVMPGIYWDSSKLNDSKTSTKAWGGALDVRVPIKPNFGIQGSIGIPFIENSTVGVGLGLFIMFKEN